MQAKEMRGGPATKSGKSGSRPDSDRPSPSGGSIWPVLILVTAIFGAITSLVVLNSPFHLELDLCIVDFWTPIFSSAIKEELIDPTDYLRRAKNVLRSSPLIDGHNDFPFLLRQQLKSKIYGHNFEEETLHSHTDFQRMKDGMMGGQFWSVYVPCPEDLVPGVDLNDPNKRVPDLNEPNVCIFCYSILEKHCTNAILILIYVIVGRP